MLGAFSRSFLSSLSFAALDFIGLRTLEWFLCVSSSEFLSRIFWLIWDVLSLLISVKRATVCYWQMTFYPCMHDLTGCKLTANMQIHVPFAILLEGMMNYQFYRWNALIMAEQSKKLDLPYLSAATRIAECTSKFLKIPLGNKISSFVWAVTPVRSKR